MKLSIGTRITTSKEGKEFIVKINGGIESWMTHALLGWVVLWTLMGIYVAYYVISGKTTEEQFYFFLTYLAFWAYFEFKAVYSWLFRQFGYELIKITPEAVYIKQAVFDLGKVHRYVRENIKDLERVAQDQKSVVGAFNKSFWVMGNQQIVFDYLGKNVGIGMHLTPKDRDALLVQLRKEFKRSK